MSSGLGSLVVKWRWYRPQASLGNKVRMDVGYLITQELDTGISLSSSPEHPCWQLLATPQGNSYRWSLWVGGWRLCLGRLGSPWLWPPGDMDSELWSPCPTSKEQLTHC